MSNIFTKYSSIENHYRDAHLNRVRKQVTETELFVATEKVHGSNLSFIVSRKSDKGEKSLYNFVDEQSQLEVNLGQRNGLVQGKFFPNACQTVFDMYKTAAVAVFQQLRRTLGDKLSSVSIFGELYGGGEVPGAPKLNRAAIQQEIRYTPEHHFYAFDILACLDQEGQEEKEKKFLSHEEAVALFTQCGFVVHAYPLRIGTLDELLQMDVDSFMTTIPSKFHGIESLQEPSEGIVIKPYSTNIFLPDGERVIIKKKSQKFAEIKDVPVVKAAAPKKPDFSSEEASTLFAELERYINKSRLSSVISKIGEVTPKNMRDVASALKDDALEELGKQYAEVKLDSLSAADKTAVIKKAMDASFLVVKTYIAESKKQS